MVVLHGRVRIAGAVLFGPADVLAVRGGLGAEKVEVCHLGALAITLDAHGG